MHITVKWVGTEKSMLCCSFPKTWTWDDIDDCHHASRILLDSASRPIPVLVDFQNGQYLPYDAINRLRPYVLNLHSNANPIICIHVNSALKSVMDFFYLMFPALRMRILIANSLTEALVMAQASSLNAVAPI